MWSLKHKFQSDMLSFPDYVYVGKMSMVLFKSGVDNLFATAGLITFILMNYGRQ